MCSALSFKLSSIGLRSWSLTMKYTANGVDQARLAAGLGLAAEVSDVDVERVRGKAEVVTPDALEDDRARQHLARVAQEELEQRELGARQLDRAPTALDVACAQVERNVGERQDF